MTHIKNIFTNKGMIKIMPIFYVISDVHGFYNEMQQALDTVGFDPKNKNHWIISCGDEWDRGLHPKEVMRYFNSLERKILIRGNHMNLFEDLCQRGYPEYYDMLNGTTKTVQILGHYKPEFGFDSCCETAYNTTKKYRESLVNYFETERFVFCHSAVPAIGNNNLLAHYTKNRQFSFNPNWRNATQEEWNAAMWENPYLFAEQGLFPPDKIVVFGHFHTSWPRCHYEGKPEWGSGADFSSYYGKNYIAIDACTAHSGRVNCLVLEDDFLEE